MKTLPSLAAVLAAGLSSFGGTTNWLERFSPHFSTNTEIVWKAPMAVVPERLWIYRRLPARPFSASVISNAIVLASLQDRGFPKPSTDDFYIWSAPNPCGVRYSILSIRPASASIAFSATNQDLLTNDVPSAEVLTNRAFECAREFGLDQAQLISKNVYSSSNASGCDETLIKGVCGRGIFLSRKLDDLSYFGDANNSAEGFSVEFGSRGKIRSFSLIWPNLKRDRESATAGPKEITRCIQGQHVMVFPDGGPNYFERLKMLEAAKTFTITKITPYYSEGLFGEMPANDAPSDFIAPFAELEAVADFGSSNVTVRVVSPITVSDVNRLLGKEPD